MDTPSSSMKIKSYFADSVEQAIQEARQELGTDAMLITSRRSSPENRTLGAYEVVFGVTGPATGAGARTRQPVAAADLSNELQSLRAQLQEIKTTLQGNRSESPSAQEAEALFEELVSDDLSRNIAREIVSSAARLRDQIARDQSAKLLPLRQYAAELISKKLQFAPAFHQAEPDAIRSAVFVGPAGAGKTTALIKIAIRECLAQRLSGRILSVDPYRVGAHERLRTLAGIVGVGFTAINSMQEFASALEEHRSKSGVLLVDTPGYTRAELDAAQETAACFARLPNKQVHLVLPASMNRASLMQAIGMYNIFQPDCLLFSRLDETESRGAMLSAALESDKPLSFCTNGQNIPEDIEPANTRILLGSMFRPQKASEAVSAA